MIRRRSQRHYNLSWSDSFRFVWFRVAKVATRSILQALQERDADLGYEYDLRFSRSRYAGFRTFAFVRNPWDRLVSCWRKMAVESGYFGDAYTDISFPEFVRRTAELDLDTCDPHLRRQTALVDRRRVDFLGRFETLERDFGDLCHRLGLGPVDLPHRNASSRGPYAEYYDAPLARLVGRLYRRDASAFGYRFDA